MTVPASNEHKILRDGLRRSIHPSILEVLPDETMACSWFDLLKLFGIHTSKEQTEL
jgi:hypothetical protein